MYTSITILIPVCNGLGLTRRCLESLWPTLPTSWRCQVVVYDDGSTDGTGEYLRSLGDRIDWIAGEGRSGYAQANNRMATKAQGRFLVMLNNDVLLRPGWLEPMVALACKRPLAAVVGNLQVYPGTHRINHAGGVFGDDGLPMNLYDGLEEGLAAAGFVRQLQYVTGACWVTSAEMFRQLGGFDERFVNGFEDVDYCLRAREHGGEVWYCGRSVVEHHVGSTTGRYAFDRQNLKRFRRRWSGRYACDLRAVVAADGVEWPPWGWGYRLLRRSRGSAVGTLTNWVCQTRLGHRARQRLKRALT